MECWIARHSLDSVQDCCGLTRLYNAILRNA